MICHPIKSGQMATRKTLTRESENERERERTRPPSSIRLLLTLLYIAIIHFEKYIRHIFKRTNGFQQGGSVAYVHGTLGTPR